MRQSLVGDSLTSDIQGGKSGYPYRLVSSPLEGASRQTSGEGELARIQPDETIERLADLPGSAESHG